VKVTSRPATRQVYRIDPGNNIPAFQLEEEEAAQMALAVMLALPTLVAANVWKQCRDQIEADRQASLERDRRDYESREARANTPG